MRALVFFAEPGPHNDVLRAQLRTRFNAKLPEGYSQPAMIDTHAHHGAKGWSDLAQVARLHRGTYDCLVVATAQAEVGVTLSKIAWGVADLKKVEPALPLIGYVEEPTRATNFNLLAAQVPMVVTEEDRAETLGVAINVAVTARADGRRDVEIGPLRVNVYTGDTHIGAQKIPFTGMQRQIMKALARHQGETVSREALTDMVYGDSENVPDGNTLDVLISRMRGTLNTLDSGCEGLGRVIQTGRGSVALVQYTPELPGPHGGGRPVADKSALFARAEREPALLVH